MEALTPFTLSIPLFKEVPDGKKKVVYYVIEISKKGTEKFLIEKRFREFDDLNNTLKKTFGNIPTLPGKTFLGITDDNNIEKRKAGLEHYLQTLIKRTDILSADSFKRFLQLENFAPEASVNAPQLAAEISGFVLGIRDFVFEIEKGLLFTAISDMNVASRVDSYLTNMKMPWEKDVPVGALVTVGAVECYLQSGKIEDGLKFDKLWFKNFPTQVICIHWDQASNYLVVGCDDGTLSALKIPQEDQYSRCEETNNYKLHTSRIMGLYLDPLTEFTYTVSEDRKLKVFELRKNNVLSEQLVSNEHLTALVGDKENKRLFISDRMGLVYIYDISPRIPSQIHVIEAYSKGVIRGLFFDNIKNYLVTANFDDGILALIDLQKPGKEKFAHNVAKFHGKKKVRCVVWSSSRAEIYTGDEDGNLTFWDAKSAGALYGMQCHTSGITKLQWMEKEGILVSAGKDKKLKFYKLPSEWRDKKVEAELLKNARLQKEANIQQAYKKLQQTTAGDSDDDDLAGWARGL